MSSSWEKVVKGATKSKSSPPKAKYIDPIVSASHTSDGTLLDIFRALQGRLRDANSVVVFKALIVVHTLVRSGNQQNVLGYLSGSKILGLENVVGGHDTAQNLNKYAVYLDRRIRTFAALKYDIIRDKAEKRAERDGIKGCNRLRALTVEKGLLRETTLLQKEMDSLAECKFYLDDMEDDVVMTALRLCVKDLLLIFQAVNEGVINVLEHYFEMSHPDATTALKIYKRFCEQTEKVVTYLSVAKKMQNIINVPVPNLKHAPVSLAKSLEEYLNDPNFEKNREEYKQNKAIADGKAPPPKETAKAEPVKAETNGKAPTPEPPKAGGDNRDFLDFFSSIEQEQQPMFPQQTGFYPQQAPNPFMQQQMTGYPGPFGQQQPMPLAPQITGFAPGGLQPNPFLQQQQTGFAPNPFLQQQPTGFGMPNSFSMASMQQGMMAPQQTGANPFRQSMMMPPSASMPTLSNQAGMGQLQTGFDQSPFGHRQSFSTATSPTTPFAASSPTTPFSATSNGRSATMPFAGPSHSSAFDTGRNMTSSPAPLTAQPTGSRNPFAPPPGTQPAAALPPQPTGPSMHQMAFDKFQAAQQQQQQQQHQQQSQQSAGQQLFSGAQNSAAPASRQMSMPARGGMMSSIASSFTINDGLSGAAGSQPVPSPATPSNAESMPFSSASTNGFGSAAPLQAQRTGFGGSLVKPFKPTSSFGASLAETLPPVPEPAAPQQTGLPNPFRSSTMPAYGLNGTSTGGSSFGTGSSAFGTGASTPQTSVASQPTGFQPQSSFGSTYFNGQQHQQHPGQPAVGSLI